MLAASFKRTKIVATIGPASSSPKILEELMVAGVNMFRLNFAHGTHEQHGEVIKAARHLSAKHNKPVAVLADIHFGRRVPGDGQHIRFSYAASNEMIERGIERVAAFIGTSQR